MLSAYLALIDDFSDKNKFEEMYLLYRQDMYRYSLFLLRNEFDAEDAVHEAFLRFAKIFSKFSEKTCQEIKAYLVIIVRNVSYDILRYKKKTCDLTFDETFEYGGQEISLEDNFLEKFDFDCIVQKIKSLAPSYQDVMLMKINYECSLKEIAQILDISESAAQQRFHRGRVLLQKALEEGDNDEQCSHFETSTATERKA